MRKNAGREMKRKTKTQEFSSGEAVFHMHSHHGEFHRLQHVFQFFTRGTFFKKNVFAGQHLKVAARSERSLREKQAKQEMTQTSLFVDVVQLIELPLFCNDRIP